MIGATAYGLWKNSALGFAGAWLFGILAPSSLTPGRTQMIVEHRMYLPLAAVIAGLVLAADRLLRRGRAAWFASAAVLGVGLTMARNHDYRSGLSLWSDTVAKRPHNAIA